MDLRLKSTSCTSHPVVKLSSELSAVKNQGVKVLKLYFNPDDIPIEVAKLYLKKHGFEVESFRKLDDGSVELLATLVQK